MKYETLSTGFPRHNIEISLKRGLVIYNELGNKTFEKKDIYKGLNLSIKSGHAARAITSMKYYGIIEDHNTKFKISENIKQYIKDEKITRNNYCNMLMNIPLYKNILKEFTLEEIISLENKEKIRSYILTLNLNQNIIDIFFEINEYNAKVYKNQKIDKNIIEIEDKKFIEQNTLIYPKDNNIEYDYFPFAIGSQKIIEIKIPKNLSKSEIELTNIAIESLKKIINQIR